MARLARDRGVKLVIKSKSMVSEEIGLNDRLISEGIEPVETDLGEYIIQLAGETPFHIIAPAIHKSREDVSDLFEEKLNTPRYERIEELAGEARRQLREKFIGADMGITGANFIVAETGTLTLVTNEGNGRMCTSMPRIHVAITGMEKVVPSLEDLAVFLRLLIRSATGQRISSYVTTVTGPRKRLDEDGPEEFHLVVVDNGRSGLLADPHFQGGAQLPALRRVPERLPGLSQGGRPRLRLGLSRPHRRGGLAGADGHLRRQALAFRLQPLRRLQGGLPGQDQHPAYAAETTQRDFGGRPLPARAKLHPGRAARVQGLARRHVQPRADVGGALRGAAVARPDVAWPRRTTRRARARWPAGPATARRRASRSVRSASAGATCKETRETSPK